MNIFPSDFNSNLTGFGGDPSSNQAQHRAAIKKTPVILVHGNTGNSAHPKWGMRMMAEFLKNHGSIDSEIWAMDYLGENNSQVILDNVHIDHIDALRTFIDRVRNYLGVSRVDLIGHSLGCGMINGYLRGLQSKRRVEQCDRGREDSRLPALREISGDLLFFVLLRGAVQPGLICSKV